MEKTYELDYGFINEFNELDEAGQLAKLSELSALPTSSEDENFQEINVSHFFDLNDLNAKTPIVASQIEIVFSEELEIEHYFTASEFVDIIGQTREAYVPGFSIKNEPLVYHLYKLATGRSLKRDLNVQRRIKNKENTLVAPVIISFDEIIATIEMGYDMRFDVDEEKIIIIKQFLEQDKTILAAKIYLTFLLRGYFGETDLEQIYQYYHHRFQKLVAETFQIEFGAPQESNTSVWDIIDNDDRDALELTWMIAYLDHHLEINGYQNEIKALANKLKGYDSQSANESYRYLANLETRFNFLLAE